MAYAELIVRGGVEKAGRVSGILVWKRPLSLTDRLLRATLFNQFRPSSLLKLCREFATLIR